MKLRDLFARFFEKRLNQDEARMVLIIGIPITVLVGGLLAFALKACATAIL